LAFSVGSEEVAGVVSRTIPKDGGIPGGDLPSLARRTGGRLPLRWQAVSRGRPRYSTPVFVM